MQHVENLSSEIRSFVFTASQMTSGLSPVTANPGMKASSGRRLTSSNLPKHRVQNSLPERRRFKGGLSSSADLLEFFERNRDWIYALEKVGLLKKKGLRVNSGAIDRAALSQSKDTIKQNPISEYSYRTGDKSLEAMLTTAQAANVSGKTTQAIGADLAAGRLFSILPPGRSRGRLLPAYQFEGNDKTRAFVRSVCEYCMNHALSPHYLHLFLSRGLPETGSICALEWLNVTKPADLSLNTSPQAAALQAMPFSERHRSLASIITALLDEQRG